MTKETAAESSNSGRGFVISRFRDAALAPGANRIASRYTVIPR